MILLRFFLRFLLLKKTPSLFYDDCHKQKKIKQQRAVLHRIELKAVWITETKLQKQELLF